MRYGSIYLITNKINGKKYVGQTTLSVEGRWQEHTYNKKNNSLISKDKFIYANQNLITETKESVAVQRLADETTYVEYNSAPRTRQPTKYQSLKSIYRALKLVG